MALPKIDTPVYEIELPLSKKTIKFRPFLVKEQKNLLMAMETDDSETIERNIRDSIVKSSSIFVPAGIAKQSTPIGSGGFNLSEYSFRSPGRCGRS